MPTMKFHDRHGKHITLSGDRLVSTATGEILGRRTCFSDRPIKPGETLELQVLEDKLDDWTPALWIGVTTMDPKHWDLSVRPDDHQDTWCLYTWSGMIYIKGKRAGRCEEWERKGCDRWLQTGDTIGLTITGDRTVSISLNNTEVPDVFSVNPGFWGGIKQSFKRTKKNRALPDQDLWVVIRQWVKKLRIASIGPEPPKDTPSDSLRIHKSNAPKIESERDEKIITAEEDYGSLVSGASSDSGAMPPRGSNFQPLTRPENRKTFVSLDEGGLIPEEFSKTTCEIAKENKLESELRTLKFTDFTRHEEDPALKTASEARDIKGRHVFIVAKSFVNSLGLHDDFFNHNFDVCFCEPCHSARGDNLKYLRGEPPKEYGLPNGWCKFGLRTKPQANIKNIFSNWHVAFHGTRMENVAKILDLGDLLIPGDVAPSGMKLEIPKNHWDPNHPNPKMRPPQGHNVNMFYFSPSIRYAGCDVYAPVSLWTNPDTGEIHKIRVAFQVRIEPGTYRTGPQTIGARSDIDPLFKNEELEWFTERRGVSMLVGLLVKVEGEFPDADVGTMKKIAEGETTMTQHLSKSETAAELKYDFIYKTPKRKQIVLEEGTKCLVLQSSEDKYVIIHPNVNEPLKSQQFSLKYRHLSYFI